MKTHRSFYNFFLMVCVASAVFIAACSSEDNTVADPGSDPTDTTDPTEPPPDPTVTAPANLAGIWEGTLTSDTQTLDIAMAFYMPDGATEGRVMGIAVDQTRQPYIMFDSGYQDVSSFSWDYEYVIGRFGAQGTSLKSYLFEDNLVSNLSGGFELSLNGNTLTGAANFDALGEYAVEINYSLQNLNDASLADLTGTWQDANADNGWDSTSTLTTLVIAADGTLDTGTGTDSGCVATATDPILDVADFSIFLFGNPDSDSKSYITLSNCGTRIVNPGTPNETTAPVDGAYDGMGVIVEDDSGSNALVMMLSSTLEKKPSMAVYNEFVFTGAPAP
jgi:hypothetical protein